jgi:hypothetical protein
LLKSKKTKPNTKLTGYQKVVGQFSLDTDTIIQDSLSEEKRIKEFNTMYLTDPVCGAVMLALAEIFRSIEWKTFDDPDGILKQSLKNVDFIGNMNDIVSAFVFGHSVMEVVLSEKDENGHVHWRDMYFRPQTTLDEWNHDRHGKVISIVQRTTEGINATIKANKCLIFRSAPTQASPLGKSLFRNAYRDWYYKTNIEKIEAIGIERDLVGLFVLQAPEDQELQDEKGQLNDVGQWAWQIVRNVKRNAQEGLVLPHGWEAKLLASPGDRQFDLNTTINRYANNIALSMLSQFLVLGVTSSSGSFALAKEQSSLFHIAIEGFAKSFAEVINNQFIGAPALQLFNKLEKRPYVKPVGIERINPNDLASFLGRMLKFNVITPDDRLEEFLRDRFGMPDADPNSVRIADTKLAYEDTKAPENDSENKTDSKEKEEK